MKVTSVKTTLLQFPRYERPPTFSVNPTHIFPELAPGGQGVRGGASVFLPSRAGKTRVCCYGIRGLFTASGRFIGIRLCFVLKMVGVRG